MGNRQRLKKNGNFFFEGIIVMRAMKAHPPVRVPANERAYLSQCAKFVTVILDPL